MRRMFFIRFVLCRTTTPAADKIKASSLRISWGPQPAHKSINSESTKYIFGDLKFLWFSLCSWEGTQARQSVLWTCYFPITYFAVFLSFVHDNKYFCSRFCAGLLFFSALRIVERNLLSVISRTEAKEITSHLSIYRSHRGSFMTHTNFVPLIIS